MWPRLKRSAIAVLCLLVLAPVAVGLAEDGSITGCASLTDPQGTVIYGDWVRVFLTTEAVAIPTVDLESVDVPLERRTKINNGHMDFFINFQKKQNATGFLIDHKLTRPDGTFAFYRIPAGHYWVVVTFPTMIGGYKCAWCVPVEVNGDEGVHLELNNANLAVPAY